MLEIFSVAVVVIRSLGLLTLAIVLPAIPQVLRAIEQASEQGSFFSFAADPYAGPTVIWWRSLMLLAVLSLIFAKKLALLMTRGLEQTNVNIDENNLRTLQRVAFSILGAYIMLLA